MVFTDLDRAKAKAARLAKKEAFEAYQEANTSYLTEPYSWTDRRGYHTFIVRPTNPKGLRGSTCVGWEVQHQETGYTTYVADYGAAMLAIEHMKLRLPKHVAAKEAAERRK